MEKDKILAKLEKYTLWIKIDRKLAGHVLITAVVYILVYLAIIFYFWSIGFQMTDIQQTLYFIGFSLLVIALYLAFTGFLLRSIK